MKKTVKPQIKTPRRGKALFSIGLDPQERAALDKAAGAEDRSSAYVARRAVLDWLKANGFLK
jgi:predicted transcriptional regulator